MLPKYNLSKLKITDLEIIKKSGKDIHPVILFTGNIKDKIKGMVFEVSSDELKQADEYEKANYKRISIKLSSGIDAWVYVNK